MRQDSNQRLLPDIQENDMFVFMIFKHHTWSVTGIAVALANTCKNCSVNSPMGVESRAAGIQWDRGTPCFI